MFTRQSVHITQSVEACTEALLGGPPQWFFNLGGEETTGQPTSKVGLHVAGVPVHKKVVVELGKPVKTASWTVIPLTWKATFPSTLFPMMTGQIELAPTEKDVTRLTVSGMYEPPLGAVGREIDAAVMHRVAEGTVQELAESIAKKLVDAIALTQTK
jgi:hypothetical protein